MENNTTKSRGSLKALFLIPSIIGVILFMIPVKNADGDWTVVVKIIADIISGAIGGFLPLLCVIILTVSAVMCLVALGKPKFIMDSPILKECFSCGPIWVVIRVLAAIFVWLTYLGVGSEGTGLVSLITSGDQGGFVLYDLLTTLVIIFVIATGGSVVYSDKAMEHLKSLGKIIYLHLSYEDMCKRISNLETRGIVFQNSETLEDMYNERLPLYNKWAQAVINCGQNTVEQTARAIVRASK